MHQRNEPTSIPGSAIDQAQPFDIQWNDRTAALVAASAVAPEFTQPQTVLVAGGSANRWIIPTLGARQIGLIFFCRGSDDELMQAALRGWRRYGWRGARGDTLSDPRKPWNEVWRPQELAVITGQVGGYVVPTDTHGRDPLTANGETNVRGVDVGTIDSDFTYLESTRFIHEATAGAGMFIIDPMGNELIEIEARRQASGGDSVDAINGFYVRL